MKQNYLLLLFILASFSLPAQTIWDAGFISFTKAPNSNETLSANQDAISTSVTLTKGNRNVLYNVITESAANPNVSPANTEWAFGTTANFNTLTYNSLRGTVGQFNPSRNPNFLNNPMVLHIISENIYIDVIFTAWGRLDGSFSYTRATAPTASIADVVPEISIFPNPTSSIFQVDEQWINQEFQIFSVTGKLVMESIVPQDTRIVVEELTAGTYFLRIDKSSQRLVVK